MSADVLNALTEYIMLVTLRAGQAPGSQPSDRERELFKLLTEG